MAGRSPPARACARRRCRTRAAPPAPDSSPPSSPPAHRARSVSPPPAPAAAHPAPSAPASSLAYFVVGAWVTSFRELDDRRLRIRAIHSFREPTSKIGVAHALLTQPRDVDPPGRAVPLWQGRYRGACTAEEVSAR